MESQKSIKIIDFSNSRKINNSKDTIEAIKSHTTSYMSPEQVTGDIVTLNSNIWAFGCILLHLATGIAPYANHNKA